MFLLKAAGSPSTSPGQPCDTARLCAAAVLLTQCPPDAGWLAVFLSFGFWKSLLAFFTGCQEVAVHCTKITIYKMPCHAPSGGPCSPPVGACHAWITAPALALHLILSKLFTP